MHFGSVLKCVQVRILGFTQMVKVCDLITLGFSLTSSWWYWADCWAPTHTLTVLFQHVDNPLYLFYLAELGFYWSLLFSSLTDVKRKVRSSTLCQGFHRVLHGMPNTQDSHRYTPKIPGFCNSKKLYWTQQWNWPPTCSLSWLSCPELMFLKLIFSHYPYHQELQILHHWWVLCRLTGTRAALSADVILINIHTKALNIDKKIHILNRAIIESLLNERSFSTNYQYMTNECLIQHLLPW